jgi:hypothetical protein
MTKKNKYILYKFIKFVKTELGITLPFTFKLTSKRDGLVTYAQYQPSEKHVDVYIKNRALADICRSFAHELVHHLQHQENRIRAHHQDIGGKIEDEANSKSGSLIKQFSYELKDIDGIDIYEL